MMNDLMVETLNALTAACRAAIEYDEAIRHWREEDVHTNNSGQSVLRGDKLDKLYGDWISKSRRAIELVEKFKPGRFVRMGVKRLYETEESTSEITNDEN